jgi:proteasome lid subunit RPN8/RPN11
MTLEIDRTLLNEIHQHGQTAYPEEAAGMMLGQVDGNRKRVIQRLELKNAREGTARHNRYLLTPSDYLRSEQEAAQQGLDVIGIYHSHPDHPNHPSDFDREWAMPWFSYLITSVEQGRTVKSRSWQLLEDRSDFIEETIILLPGNERSGSQEFA